MKPSNLSPFVRIALRIFGGYMIGRGWINDGTANLIYDPQIIGAIALGISEGWYLLAKRFDWAK